MLVRYRGRLLRIVPSPGSTPRVRTNPQTDWSKYLLYGGIGAAVIVVGYGAYTALENFFYNPNAAAQSICGRAASSFTAEYIKTYDGYIKANNGGALTTQQQANLNTISDQIDNALACVQGVAQYNDSVWSNALTYIGLVAATTIGAVAAFKAWLKYKNAPITSGAEMRAGLRGSVIKTNVDAGNVSAEDGTALIKQSGTIGDAEASAEASALGTQASADLAATTDTSLIESIRTFVQTIIDIIVNTVYYVYDYFAYLLGA